MFKKSVPNKKITELEKRIKYLEAEKVIMNMAIDVADETFNIDIRKKYLCLFFNGSLKPPAHLKDSNALKPYQILLDTAVNTLNIAKSIKSIDYCKES